MTGSTKVGLAILLGLLPEMVFAGPAYTLRVGGDFTHFKNQTSIFSVGFENFSDLNLGYKFEFGEYLDQAEGHRGAPFGSVLVGKRFGDYGGFNFTAFLGTALLGYTDSVQGSLFAFTEEVILGYKNVGIGYKHMSNANLAFPNLGRDYVSLTVAIPF